MSGAFAAGTLEVAGCRVTLKRGGAGRRLLYLHGANAAPAIQRFMEELARDFDVLRPGHPGFGGSDEPGWLDNIHDLAYFYLGFMERLDLRDTIVVGSSIGGWVALEIAVRNASRIRALSLVAPSGIHVAGLAKGDLFLWPPEKTFGELYFDQGLAERVLAQSPAPQDEKNMHTLARLAWEPRFY